MLNAQESILNEWTNGQSFNALKIVNCKLTIATPKGVA